MLRINPGLSDATPLGLIEGAHRVVIKTSHKSHRSHPSHLSHSEAATQ